MRRRRLTRKRCRACLEAIGAIPRDLGGRDSSLVGSWWVPGRPSNFFYTVMFTPSGRWVMAEGEGDELVLACTADTEELPLLLASWSPNLEVARAIAEARLSGKLS
jgi:hypothetical protein